ncbi:MAG: transcription-repair coupling factor [Bacteroidota bacterium]|nr:transcription-repair coupling factor [Bacteroidota bacterium]
MSTTLEQLRGLYAEDARVFQLQSHLREDKPVKVHLQGVIGSLVSLIAAETFEKQDRPQLILANDKEEAAYLLNDIERLIGDKDALFYPGSYRRPYEIEETNNSNILLRAEVLNRINSRRKPFIMVSYPEALFEKVVNKKELKGNTLTIKVGDSIDVDFLNETLFEYRFERVDFVSEPGQFSVRGGIVDVFSFSNDLPYRIEFFGDEIESIRTFDIESQLSQDKVKRLDLVPNVEDKRWHEARESFLDYIPSNTTIWLKSAATAESKLDKLFEKAVEAFENLKSEIKRAEPADLFIDSKAFLENLESFQVVEFGTEKRFSNSGSVSFGTSPQPAFQKNFNLLVDTLSKNTQEGWSNYLLCGGQKQVERFYSIFEDIGRNVRWDPVIGILHEGFEDPVKKVALYTDHQIFERYQRFRLKTGFEKKQTITLQELNSLQYGDFVTHIDHGVGKFGGLQKIDVNGKTQEAIKLIYRDNDVLYISIHSLHKISKFNGKEGTEPSINKLGSPAWQNLKSKTKKKVKEIAFDLIQLYAKRKSANGHAFAPDSYLQHELEASFIYEDTPDQVKATAEVKADMENQIPMDRLVCGDVGFGKTEVAIRAAFKAATDGKQVAILVPTTILAFQHFKTFSSRLKEMPVTIDYINRFRSQKQQKETLKGLKEGKIDIVIGTHRLVSKDVEFNDLGLLIIDEEQKFGVSVKDKLKTLRVNLDTLTLSATPIPRTLQFSLMAARDLSVMTTPPSNRQPIETQVIGFNEELIRDAVMYELSRGGQIFFIHNRIENIHEVAGMLQRLVPDARIAIGHGQMDGKKLEEVLIGFMEGESDILVSTTIIENGLDVPNANTIMINNAHHFGLSDLHQMRGRVGRSNRKAFCKLIAPPLSSLPDDSRKRLTALEQFSDLGSGFKIALRDLEIRGAGDLLGGEQSGFINEMGFDTYQKILAEAVRELKENEFKDLYQGTTSADITDFVDECQLDTDLELLIPDDYVNNIEERLRLYQKMDSLDNIQQLESFRNELDDRFGDLPPQVEDLLSSIRLRWMAKEAGMEKLVLKQGKMIGYFISKPDSPYYQSEMFARVLEYLKTHPHSAQMKQKNQRLSLSIEKVTSIPDALAIMRELEVPKETVE